MNTIGDRQTENLAEFVERWIAERGTTAKWLADRAGIPHSTFTEIKRGRTPRPETIRRLADAMRVPRSKLFILADYLTQEDIVYASPAPLPPDVEELVIGYQSLPEEGKRWLLGSLRGMQRLATQSAASPPEPR